MTVAADTGPWDEGIIVEKSKLYRTLDFVLEKAVQNHGLHATWNEGAGEFGSCTREDCKEAREVLGAWGIHRGVS